MSTYLQVMYIYKKICIFDTITINHQQLASKQPMTQCQYKKRE